MPVVPFPSWLLLILMPTPDPPAFEIPVKAPEETTEKPCKVLLLMDTVVVAIPALFIMPVTVPVLAFMKLTTPPLVLPSWLLLMLMSELAAPVFEIPIKAPLTAVFIWPVIIFEVITIDVAAAVLLIHVKFPVPKLVPNLIPLPSMLKVPVPVSYTHLTLP